MPKGSVLEAEFHYDNSGNNRFNPDPTAEVRWGSQTWEEMMIGWFDIAVPKDADISKVLPPRQRRSRRGGQQQQQQPEGRQAGAAQ